MQPGESIEERNLRIFGCIQPVAFITGSVAARVGRRIAEHLYASGFRVVLHGHRPPTGDAEIPDFADYALYGAVEEEGCAARWCREVVERFGAVHLLVNSAAIWEPKPLEESTADDFRRYFEVNALGTAMTCKHFGLQMTRQAAGGAIVNISDWAIRRPYVDFAAYFPSKGAVETLTHSMAIELAVRNPKVRVNAVLPGPVMLDSSIGDDRRQRLVATSLLQREGTPDDVAGAVIFLATSPYITGVCLPVDGGRTIYAGPSADPIAHPKSGKQ